MKFRYNPVATRYTQLQQQKRLKRRVPMWASLHTISEHSESPSKLGLTIQPAIKNKNIKIQSLHMKKIFPF